MWEKDARPIPNVPSMINAMPNGTTRVIRSAITRVIRNVRLILNVRRKPNAPRTGHRHPLS